MEQCLLLNAANEVCVYKFLNGKIGIKELIKTVEYELEHHNLIKNPTLDEIFKTDKEIRNKLH